MTPKKKFNIGRIEARTVSFGDYAIHDTSSDMTEEEFLNLARAEIAKLITAMPQYRADIAYDDAMDSARRAQRQLELDKRERNAKKLRQCLEALFAAVGKVTALASAVTAVQEAVRHL
jgi:hypothetical protein